MFEVVCFDLDNTLFDHDEAEIAAYDTVIQYIQSQFPLMECNISKLNQAKQDVKERVDTYERALYFKTFLKKQQVSPQLVLECWKLFWNTFLQTCKLMPYAENVLQLLQSLDTKQIIITNFDLVHQLQKLETLQISQYFSDVVCSEEIGCKKPSSLLYNYALQGYNISKCCMIGDRFTEDIMGSLKAGLFAIHLNISQQIPFCIHTNKYISVQNHQILHTFFQVCHEKFQAFIELCHRVGERFDITQHTGGNVSIKWDFLNYKCMFVKASGCHLATIDKISGWSFGYILNNTFVHLFGEKPSIEACMHAVMSKEIVIHVHPTNIINDIKQLAATNCCQCISYIPPGDELCQAILPYKEHECIYLENHGIVVNLDLQSTLVSMYTLNNYIKTNQNEECIDQVCNTISFQSSSKCITLFSNCFLDPSLNVNVLQHFFTPDTAVFLKQIVHFEASFELSHCVVLFQQCFFCKAPTYKQALAMIEMLKVHLHLHLKNATNKTQPNVSVYLSSSEASKLQTRPDEMFRLSK